MAKKMIPKNNGSQGICTAMAAESFISFPDCSGGFSGVKRKSWQKVFYRFLKEKFAICHV